MMRIPCMPCHDCFIKATKVLAEFCMHCLNLCLNTLDIGVKHLSSYCESVGARLSPDTLCATWIKLSASNEHAKTSLPPSKGEIVIVNIVRKY